MSTGPVPRPLADVAAKHTLDAEQRVRAALRKLDVDPGGGVGKLAGSRPI